MNQDVQAEINEIHELAQIAIMTDGLIGKIHTESVENTLTRNQKISEWSVIRTNCEDRILFDLVVRLKHPRRLLHIQLSTPLCQPKVS